MITWGLIAACQCLIRTPSAFYATRVLLGICESGFIPGGVYYISTMYTHAELAKMIAWLWVVSPPGGRADALATVGILQARAARG